MADQQPQTEDWILFLSTVLGSAAMAVSSNPTYYLYGLTVGAASKALLSLGPDWESWEDWALFLGALLGSLGSSLTNNSNYMLYGLVLGAIGKAIPSIVKSKSLRSPKNLEDWLLLFLPLITGLASAFSSQPKFAEVGLFFGMIGKSLAGVAPSSGGAQVTAPPQASGLAGNRNFILWDNCIPLVNPSVAFTAGSDLHTSGNWDLQVNAYAPSGTDAYMQFVLAVTTSGEVQWSIENWPISGDNLFNTCDQPLFKLPSSFLPKGYSIGVKMNTDPNTLNVVSVEFSVSDSGGSTAARKTVALNSTLPICSGAWRDSYLSQVIGFEPNVVGYNGGVAVEFSVGSSGTLACTADSIYSSASIPSCAEAKAGTVENSNLQYSMALQSSPSLVTIGVFVP